MSTIRRIVPSFRVRRFVPLAAIALSVALWPRGAHATMPSDLCTGNPCVVSGTIVVDPGSSLDFGATTDLVFGPTANLTADGVTFTAKTITLQSGSRISKGGNYG